MMLGISELQVGKFVAISGQPHEITFRRHTKLGRGGALLRLTVKNLVTGNTSELTLHGNEKLMEAEVSRQPAQFLYADCKKLYFMDKGTFDQFSLERRSTDRGADFLVEGQAVEVLNCDRQPVGFKIPIKVDLKIVETLPGVKGDSQGSGGTKSAKLESGATVQVPLFIETGDRVRVNTETGRYVERLKNGN